MKNLILLIAVLFTFSCKKNDNTTTPSGTTNPIITTKNPPEVSSVDKFNLKTGLILEIDGKNFSTNPADNVIKINGVNAIDVITIDNKLQSTIPQEATSGDLVLTASGKKFDLGSVVISQYKPSNGWEVSQFFSGRDGVIQYFTFEDKVFFLQQSSKNFYQFDGNKWTKMKDVPIELFNQEITFTANGKGYLMSGITKTAGVFSRAMWEYDPISDKWTEIANFPGVARISGIGFSVGSKAYYGLGINESNQNLNDIWEFDGSSKKWTKKNNAPFSGSVSPYTYLDGKIYMYFANLLYEYNTQNDTWKKKTGSIKAETPDVLVTSNNLIYAIAKEYYVNENAPLKLYYYDTINDNFIYIKDFSGAQRYRIQGFVINNKLFAGLGYDGRLNTPRAYKDLWSLKL